MNHPELSEILALFQQARAYLIERTCKEEPEVFLKLYRYENNEKLLKLSLEQEFIAWINHHFELAKSAGLLENPAFLQAMLKLIGVQETPAKDLLSEMGLVSWEILQQKKEILQSIIEVDANSEKNYQRLLYSLEKDKVLFQRKFNQLLNEVS